MRVHIEQQTYGRPAPLCPVKATDVGRGALKSALARYEAAAALEAEKRLARDKLEHQLERAQAEDAEAVAEAWEKGSKDPGGKRVEQTRKLIETTEREARAAEVAVSRAAVAVNEAWEAEGQAIASDLREKLAKLANVSSELLDGWLKTYNTMTGIARLLQCGAGFDPQTARPTGWVPRLHAVTVNSSTGQVGVAAAPASVVEALRTLGKPPAPKVESVQNPHRLGPAMKTPPPAPKATHVPVAPDGTPIFIPDDHGDD